MLYLDACAVVKRYVDERDGATALMEQLLVDAAPWGGLVASEWMVLEFTSALAKKRRTGQLRPHAYGDLLSRFRVDVDGMDLIPVDSATLDGATRLMERVGGTRSIHSGDAIHLHTAVQLRGDLDASGALVFVTADDGLKSVAAADGLPVFDPRFDRIPDLERLIDG